MVNVWSWNISVKTFSTTDSCANWVSVRQGWCLSVVSRFPVSALLFQSAGQMEYGK